MNNRVNSLIMLNMPGVTGGATCKSMDMDNTMSTPLSLSTALTKTNTNLASERIP